MQNSELTSGDVIGLLRWVLTGFVALLVTIGGFIWRVSAKVHQFKADVATLEGEIKTTKERRTAVDNRFQTIEGRQMLFDANVRGIDEAYGELRAQFAQFLQRDDDSKRTERLRHDENLKAMGKLGERIAAMESAVQALVRENGE